MSRAPRDPITAFLRGAFESWLDGRQPLEEIHLCDEDDGQVRVEIVRPITGEDLPLTYPRVFQAVRTVSEMGSAPRKAGRRAVKTLRDQMTPEGENDV